MPTLHSGKPQLYQITQQHWVPGRGQPLLHAAARVKDNGKQLPPAHEVSKRNIAIRSNVTPKAEWSCQLACKSARAIARPQCDPRPPGGPVVANQRRREQEKQPVGGAVEHVGAQDSPSEQKVENFMFILLGPARPLSADNVRARGDGHQVTHLEVCRRAPTGSNPSPEATPRSKTEG